MVAEIKVGRRLVALRPTQGPELDPRLPEAERIAKLRGDLPYAGLDTIRLQ